jgi:nucleoside-diphosphate-sugar epimerase
MNRILITGSSGFVGTNLYAAFHKDFNLTGLDITQKGAFPTGKVFGWDEIHRLPAQDAIIHLAGIAHDTSNALHPEVYHQVNVGLTRTVFEYFLASEAKLFIYFSSVKAVADAPGETPVTEETPANPATHYGQSKKAAEAYLLAKGCPEGKTLVILRPCMIHGPGNKGNLNLLYRMVAKGIPWPLGAFENQRSYLSVDNLVFFLRQILSREIDSGVYHLADDETLSTRDLIILMAASLDRKPHVWNLSPTLIKHLAKAGDYLPLPLNSERLKKLTESYIVSNQKIKTALGISALPVRAKDGIAKTLNHFSA